MNNSVAWGYGSILELFLGFMGFLVIRVGSSWANQAKQIEMQEQKEGLHGRVYLREVRHDSNLLRL